MEVIVLYSSPSGRAGGALAAGGLLSSSSIRGPFLSRRKVVVAEYTVDNLALLKERHQQRGRHRSSIECEHRGQASAYLNNNTGDAQPARAIHQSPLYLHSAFYLNTLRLEYIFLSSLSLSCFNILWIITSFSTFAHLAIVVQVSVIFFYCLLLFMTSHVVFGSYKYTSNQKPETEEMTQYI